MHRPSPYYSVVVALCAASLVAIACGGPSREDEGNDNSDGSTEDGISGDSDQGDSGADTGSDDGPTGGEGDSGDDATGSDGGTGTGPGGDLDCGGKVYACTNGVDDDDDGLVDLDDKECTGPCDDDEASFATGIPGDNMDCKQDCFFDGNSGEGDDGCNWDLKCDPANPGADIGCAYTGGNNCPDPPPPQDEGCIDFCTQFVPNGCDCFGCCEVEVPGGDKIWIFLNGNAECSLSNLDACTTCTPRIEDCGNDCDPTQCEVCFGETEPPEGCDDPGCPYERQSCSVTEDCPDGYYCVTGCCAPPPPV